MFVVPDPPGAPPAAPLDMTRAGATPYGAPGALVPVPGAAPGGPPPGLKKGILAALVCAGAGAAIGIFVTRAMMKAHAKKKD